MEILDHTVITDLIAEPGATLLTGLESTSVNPALTADLCGFHQFARLPQIRPQVPSSSNRSCPVLPLLTCLAQNIPVSERVKLQFRAEAFNVMNHPLFGLPNTAVGAPAAGVISSQVNTPRDIQLALKLLF